MVGFTADWDPSCKFMEKLVLNTQQVKDVVDAHQVVPLLADWTDGDNEVTAMLERLGSKNIPILAIFPAGQPDAPIVLRGAYTQQQVIDALKQAGPSSAGSANKTVSLR